MIAHGEKTNGADEQKGGQGGNAHIHAEGKQQPIEQAAHDARHGIDFLLENQRHAVEEDVADDTSGTARDASHDDCHPHGMAAVERLLHPCDEVMDVFDMTGFADVLKIER